jgi:hypothetical protein
MKCSWLAVVLLGLVLTLAWLRLIVLRLSRYRYLVVGVDMR